jgi:hypothetical protein
MSSEQCFSSPFDKLRERRSLSLSKRQTKTLTPVPYANNDVLLKAVLGDKECPSPVMPLLTL